MTSMILSVMVPVIVVTMVVAVLALVAVAAYTIARHRFEALSNRSLAVDDAIYQAVGAAMAEMAERAGADRDAAVRTALQHSAVVDIGRQTVVQFTIAADLRIPGVTS